MSGRHNEFVSFVLELMQSIGPVSARRMFGGYGIFLDHLMFAIIVDNVLYLKTNQETETAFKTRGLDAFKYTKQGKEISLSYYQAPDEVFEDHNEMIIWANMAYSAATRKSSGK